MKVVITPRGFANCGEENVKYFQKAGISLVYNQTGKAYTKEEFYALTADADGVIVGVETVDKAYIDSHPMLRAVVKFGVGLDNIDVAYCQEKGIFVGKTAGSNARSVAETAISFILADSKNLYESISNTKANGWSKMTGYEVEGKTVGIAGFGAIGKKVAQMAFGLGMKVLAYDPYGVDEAVAQKFDVTSVGLDALLERSDFVSLHIPLTEETKDLIGLSQLKTMKPQAVLINTARGGIVDEKALIEAIDCGEIAGAALDVLEKEPAAPDSPLLNRDSIIVTNHVASYSKESLDAISLICAGNIIKLYSGEEPLHRVV